MGLEGLEKPEGQWGAIPLFKNLIILSRFRWVVAFGWGAVTMRKLAKLFVGVFWMGFMCSCAGTKRGGDQIVVSVEEQRLVLLAKGEPVKSYPVSTSKFGVGSQPRSNRTPLGKMYVREKIGDGARPGTVFKSRRPTGEVVKPNSPGRDPIVSRILWLEGKEVANANTRNRMIYIHGTPEEKRIGQPASYGCIRMRSKEVIDLYDRVGVGTGVYVTPTAVGL